MTGPRIVVVGAGGFGREVVEIARAARGPGTRVATVDDLPSTSSLSLLRRRDVAYLGPVETWLPGADDTCVVAVGDPQARRRLADLLTARGAVFTTLVHPDATVAGSAVLTPGVVVAPGARVSTDTTLEAHVHVDQNATVAHDCVVGACARLNPAACLSGDVRVGSTALIGANATVLQGLTVGDAAVVGAGAVVTTDVPEHAVVRGVPAR